MRIFGFLFILLTKINTNSAKICLLCRRKGMVDKAITANASGTQKLGDSLQSSMRLLFTRPHKFVAMREVLFFLKIRQKTINFVQKYNFLEHGEHKNPLDCVSSLKLSEKTPKCPFAFHERVWDSPPIPSRSGHVGLNFSEGV